LIGRVQVPVKELISKPNEVIRRTDKLVGFEDATAMSGTLQYVDDNPNRWKLLNSLW
jgi:hypothetical protein